MQRQNTRRQNTRYSATAIALLLTAVTVTGCGSWWLPSPHRIEIQQGNILSSEAIAQVAPGMSKIEVINIVGKPITTSVFDDERWDYIYSLNRSGGKPNSKRFTVFFKDDTVFRVESDGFEKASSSDG